MRIFCKVVENQSFTRAAELMNISVPMASKHVSHLEKSIGTQLLYRNNRNLQTTEQGEKYYRDCTTALEILEQAAHQATCSKHRLNGTLRISVPVWFSCNKFATLMTDFRQQYPEIELQLSLTNKHIDLNSDGEDVALRLSHHLSDNLIARKLTHLHFVLVAAPRYIAQHGLPETPHDLRLHKGILPTYTDMSQQIARCGDTQIVLELPSVVRSNQTQMVAEMVRAGAGIGYVPIWLAQDDLANGRLVRVLPECELPPIPLYAVYTNRQFMNAKLRTFIDFLAEKLA